MSTKNTSKTDKGRGLRHKLFRKEVLGKTQVELEGWLEERGIDKSQSSISAYDQGSAISKDMLIAYAEAGMNIHWYFTGEGPMLYDRLQPVDQVKESSTNYQSISGNIKFRFSTEPLAEFLKAMQGYKEDYISIINSSTLSKDEQQDLLDRIREGIKEKFTLIQ